MSTSYLSTRIAEAMQQAKGHRQRAQRLLQEWARDDSRLLYALAGPALPGLVARAMQGVGSTARASAPVMTPAFAAPRKADVAAGDLDTLIAQMGANFAQGPAVAQEASRQDEVLRRISKEQLKRRLQRDHGWPAD